MAEFAACLPILMILVFGAMECCTMIFVRQSLAVVAYEGMRVAVLPGSAPADVTNRCNQVITERKLRGTSFRISPARFNTQPPGTPLTITVSAPAAANQIFPLKFFSGTLSARLVMAKE